MPRTPVSRRKEMPRRPREQVPAVSTVTSILAAESCPGPANQIKTSALLVCGGCVGQRTFDSHTSTRDQEEAANGQLACGAFGSLCIARLCCKYVIGSTRIDFAPCGLIM